LKVICSNCGNSIVLERETDFIECEYCSSSLYLKYYSALKYYYFSPIITEKRAALILIETLRMLGLDKTKFKLQKKIFLPFGRKGESLKVYPLFSPHPSFLSSLQIPSSSPLFYTENVKEWGDLIKPDDETLLLAQRENKESLSIYQLPFYIYESESTTIKTKFFIEATAGKIYFEKIPESISKNQVNKVVSFLFVYFFFFATISYFLKPPLFSFFLTLAISLTASYFITESIMRKLD